MGSRKRKQSGPANPLGRAKLSGESDRQPESASAARDAAWVYLVSIDRAAAKVLLGFPEKDQLRIRDRIDALAANPRPADCKKLQGEDGL